MSKALAASIEGKYSATIDFNQSTQEWDTLVFPLLSNEEKTHILSYHYGDYQHIIDLILKEILEKEMFLS